MSGQQLQMQGFCTTLLSPKAGWGTRHVIGAANPPLCGNPNWAMNGYARPTSHCDAIYESNVGFGQLLDIMIQAVLLLEKPAQDSEAQLLGRCRQ